MTSNGRNTLTAAPPETALAVRAYGGAGCLGFICVSSDFRRPDRNIHLPGIFSISLVDFGDVIKKDESQPLIKCPRCKKGTPLFIQAEGRFNHRTTLALQIDL